MVIHYTKVETKLKAKICLKCLYYSSVFLHVIDFISIPVSLRKHTHAIYRYFFKKQLKKFVVVFYAPNFEEVEGAYWFGSVRAVQ